MDCSYDRPRQGRVLAPLRGPARPQPVAVAPNDLAVLMYTGGTTGVSKGAELTHRNILANLEQTGARASVGKRNRPG